MASKQYDTYIDKLHDLISYIRSCHEINNFSGIAHLYITTTKGGGFQGYIKKHLVRPDRTRTVDHWLNYAGKRCYFLWRIEKMEADPDFIEAFQRYVRRRKLTPNVVNETILQRKSTQGQVKRFAESLTDEDMQFLKVTNEMAAIMQNAIKHGVRTPNK